MNRNSATIVLLALLGLVGCHRGGAPDAGAGPVVVTNVDAGPPPLPELSIVLRYPSAPIAAMDGGTPAADAGTADAGVALESLELRPGERPTLPPVQDLTVLVNRGLRNVRIRVLDEADRVIPSDEQLDAKPTAIVDQVHFLDPLIAGHRYVLVLDPQNGDQIRDERGQPVPDQRLEFTTTGERPPPVKPSKKAPPKKRRHHR